MRNSTAVPALSSGENYTHESSEAASPAWQTTVNTNKSSHDTPADRASLKCTVAESVPSGMQSYGPLCELALLFPVDKYTLHSTAFLVCTVVFCRYTALLTRQSLDACRQS